MISLSNPPHYHLVGLGLIGGSIAGGLKDTPYRLTGWDNLDQRRQDALDRKLIEEVYSPGRLPESVSGVILAVPVPEMVSVVEEILEGSAQPQFITDVGSTKEEICNRMRNLLPADISFIGAHPMAGSEESGLSASDPILFENAICVITPSKENQTHLLDVIQLWETLGAHVFEMNPSEHDRAVAYVSHLPHLNAAALLHGVGSLQGHEETVLPLASGGFRDTTRVAAGDPDLWRDILESNRPRVTSAIDRLIEVLKDVKGLMESSKWGELKEWLEEARTVRSEIPAKTKGLVGTLFELKILAPDQPGILAHVTGALADASINISDIEVLRVREGERGTIRLRFRRKHELERARSILAETPGEIEII